MYADLAKATTLLARLLEIIETGDHITDSHYGTEINEIRAFLQYMEEQGIRLNLIEAFKAWRGV